MVINNGLYTPLLMRETKYNLKLESMKIAKERSICENIGQSQKPLFGPKQSQFSVNPSISIS